MSSTSTKTNVRGMGDIGKFTEDLKAIAIDASRKFIMKILTDYGTTVYQNIANKADVEKNKFIDNLYRVIKEMSIGSGFFPMLQKTGLIKKNVKLNSDVIDEIPGITEAEKTTLEKTFLTEKKTLPEKAWDVVTKTLNSIINSPTTDLSTFFKEFKMETNPVLIDVVTDAGTVSLNDYLSSLDDKTRNVVTGKLVEGVFKLIKDNESQILKTKSPDGFGKNAKRELKINDVVYKLHTLLDVVRPFLDLKKETKTIGVEADVLKKQLKKMFDVNYNYNDDYSIIGGKTSESAETRAEVSKEMTELEAKKQNIYNSNVLELLENKKDKTKWEGFVRTNIGAYNSKNELDKKFTVDNMGISYSSLANIFEAFEKKNNEKIKTVADMKKAIDSGYMEKVAEVKKNTAEGKKKGYLAREKREEKRKDKGKERVKEEFEEAEYTEEELEKMEKKQLKELKELSEKQEKERSEAEFTEEEMEELEEKQKKELEELERESEKRLKDVESERELEMRKMEESEKFRRLILGEKRLDDEVAQDTFEPKKTFFNEGEGTSIGFSSTETPFLTQPQLDIDNFIINNRQPLRTEFNSKTYRRILDFT